MRLLLSPQAQVKFHSKAQNWWRGADACPLLLPRSVHELLENKKGQISEKVLNIVFHPRWHGTWGGMLTTSMLSSLACWPHHPCPCSPERQSLALLALIPSPFCLTPQKLRFSYDCLLHWEIDWTLPRWTWVISCHSATWKTTHVSHRRAVWPHLPLSSPDRTL